MEFDSIYVVDAVKRAEGPPWIEDRMTSRFFIDDEREGKQSLSRMDQEIAVLRSQGYHVSTTWIHGMCLAPLRDYLNQQAELQNKESSK